MSSDVGGRLRRVQWFCLVTFVVETVLLGLFLELLSMDQIILACQTRSLSAREMSTYWGMPVPGPQLSFSVWWSLLILFGLACAALLGYVAIEVALLRSRHQSSRTGKAARISPPGERLDAGACSTKSQAIAAIAVTAGPLILLCLKRWLDCRLPVAFILAKGPFTAFTILCPFVVPAPLVASAIAAMTIASRTRRLDVRDGPNH